MEVQINPVVYGSHTLQDTNTSQSNHLKGLNEFVQNYV